MILDQLKENLGSKWSFLKGHISAQNEGKRVLTNSIFQNFLGGLPQTPLEVTPTVSKTHSLPENQLESSDSSTFEVLFRLTGHHLIKCKTLCPVSLNGTLVGLLLMITL